MPDEAMLTPAQRRDLAAYAGVDADAMDDNALIEEVAAKIAITGEMSVDPDGSLDLMRGNVLVALDVIAHEDRDMVEHPEQLQLAVFLRAGSAAELADLEADGLLDPPDDSADDDALAAHDAHGVTHDDDWAFAHWGAMCTNLTRDTGLSRRMEVLEQALTEAEHVLESRDPDMFAHRLAALQHQHDEDDGA